MFLTTTDPQKNSRECWGLRQGEHCCPSSCQSWPSLHYKTVHVRELWKKNKLHPKLEKEQHYKDQSKSKWKRDGIPLWLSLCCASFHRDGAHQSTGPVLAVTQASSLWHCCFSRGPDAWEILIHPLTAYPPHLPRAGQLPGRDQGLSPSDRKQETRAKVTTWFLLKNYFIYFPPTV